MRPEQKQLGGLDDGYIFRSEHSKAEQRNAGVVFGIQNEIVRRLPCLPQTINDRLPSLPMPLRGPNLATIISTYAKPMTGTDEEKIKFYEESHVLLESLSKVTGLTHEIADWNENGLLLRTSVENCLLLTNAFFRLSMLKAPQMVTLAAVGMRSASEARSAGHAGDQNDLRYRWLDRPQPRRLQDEAVSAILQGATSDQQKGATGVEQLSIPSEHEQP
nr:unnamed protein product [Spirometra erinaceieuropaei]